MNLIDAIRIAFAARKKPHRTATESAHPEYDDIYIDAMHFSSLTWGETNCAMWREFSDAVFGFTSESFCYFLPGIMMACVIEKNVDLRIVDSIIYSLDRMAGKDDWDAERWKILSPSECSAVKEWLLWVRCMFGPDYLEDEVARALATLEALENKNH